MGVQWGNDRGGDRRGRCEGGGGGGSLACACKPIEQTHQSLHLEIRDIRWVGPGGGECPEGRGVCRLRLTQLRKAVGRSVAARDVRGIQGVGLLEVWEGQAWGEGRGRQPAGEAWGL